MRVGIIGLLQESNTFIDRPTTFEMFAQDLLETGEVIRHHQADTHHEIGGFFEGLDSAGIDAVPIFVARAMPYGVVEAEAFDRLIQIMFDELEKAGPFDGMLVAPHGATVSASYPDVDGYWLMRLRRHVGQRVPIVGTLDPHVNLSTQMVIACNALVAYRSNPHIDQRQRGKEAACIMARILSGEIQPTMAASWPPIAINVESQHTAEPPCHPMYELADQMLECPNVLSNSILLGFPYADVEEMGSGALVVTDNDGELAQNMADELGQHMWVHRQEFAGQFTEVAEAMDQAMQLSGSVCLLDIGDNVGGGSPGDGTILAHALHERKILDSFVCLFDPDSVQKAKGIGVGERIRLHVGGKTDDRHGKPLEEEFCVVSLHDGRFRETKPRHGGRTEMDQGFTAVVATDHGLTVMLTSLRMAPTSLVQLTSCGLDPASFHILIAKGVHAPVAAYQEVCQHLIRVNTPGVTCADLTCLPYRHRRRPMFPFEPDTIWQS